LSIRSKQTIADKLECVAKHSVMATRFDGSKLQSYFSAFVDPKFTQLILCVREWSKYKVVF